MKATPSRFLNERIGFLGLSTLDIGLVGYFLIFTNLILRPTGLEILTFPFTAVFGVSLISIRLKNRPKVMRDFVSYRLQKKITRGLL